MIEPPDGADPANAAADAATDAAMRHWADAVVPLAPPPYSFERVLVRSHRRKIRRRMLVATASMLSFVVLFAGLALGNVLPGLRLGSGNCGNATNTVAVAKGNNPMSRKTEYSIGGLLAAAALTAGVVAGCNGGPGSPGGTTGAGSPNSSSSSGGAVVLPTAPSSTSGAPSPSATSGATTAGVPQCQVANLVATVNVVAGSQAMGQESLNITLTNTSGRSCTVYGFPGLALEDKNQDIQATKLSWDPGVPKTLITLANGASASTTAQFDADVPASGEPASGPCEAPSFYLEVTPPNNQNQLEAKITGAPSGITVCNHGAIQVLALVPGSTGSGQ